MAMQGLIEHHFRSHGNTPDHVCYPTFKRLFEEIEKNNVMGINILETGTAAYGTASTYLFDAFVRKYGGRFWSVDSNPATVDRARPNVCPGTSLTCGDSVEFLSAWTRARPQEQAHVVYLDSYDVDWQHPEPSGEHGLREFHAIQPALKDGSLMLIDDTPVGADVFAAWNPELYRTFKALEENKGKAPLPGKGMYVVDHLGRQGIVAHWYQVLYRWSSSTATM